MAGAVTAQMAATVAHGVTVSHQMLQSSFRGKLLTSCLPGQFSQNCRFGSERLLNSTKAEAKSLRSELPSLKSTRTAAISTKQEAALRQRSGAAVWQNDMALEGRARTRNRGGAVPSTSNKESVNVQTGGESDVEDNKILPYCSINKGENKKTLGEMEQDFLEALQSFYFDGTPVMSNEEFDNLKEELMWEGSSVVVMSTDEKRFMEAALAYQTGKKLISDEEYDALKLKLKKQGSKVAVEGPRCSLRTKKVYSDCTVDYLRMTLLNVPAALIALLLVFFVDDLTGFEITYLLELPEPYSFLFTWFVVLPITYLTAQSLTNLVLKNALILKGPCPNCSTENITYFGDILTVENDSRINDVKCESCGYINKFDLDARLILLDETPPPPPKAPKAPRPKKVVASS
eukprot:TRINITY_DN20790_c0_g1_i1.p1 TRINITY_DN20790_c0_g1~~TRINITY_DN20790_c0_g1_i1.p1  ORF type:complete len:403 (+),score=95.91 TRINITY_DN20790_c0_g1_i1:152-1360(+)